MMNINEEIRSNKTYLGIELGSTRIKAVLIGEDHSPIASGNFAWENKLENGVWTYSLDHVWEGLQKAYSALAADVEKRYGEKLRHVGAMGVSAMMHGYLAFDEVGEQLAPFRTWRNTITGEAAKSLTEEFGFNIPQRWSAAHLYQAVLNGEEHVSRIRYLTTLAGYVHWRLTGEFVIGVGDGSGMFPIDSDICDYNEGMMARFDALVREKNYPWKLRDILPRVLKAGENAGALTSEGAALLDPTGTLTAGVPMCPPEGDAGTGMTATNAVTVRTGNVSAGTSVFAMIVLEKPLSKVYPEIDMVTTPDGKPVAMVHCNNCTNEINAWAEVFRGFLEAIGENEVDMRSVYSAMFMSSLRAEKDAGGLVLYNYLSGEPITDLTEGRPMLVRDAEAHLNFENLMRAQLYSALATLKLGMDILSTENVALDRLIGHGGFFKDAEAGQRAMAAATNTPVSVMETAGEGGPWGMALLAAYSVRHDEGQSLGEYLDKEVFVGQKVVTVEPCSEEAQGFEKFMKRYTDGLAVERCAVEHLK
jgi:sugar (pentulose or hexulose) kinase